MTVWNLFTLPDQPVPMLACVMVTVPANELIGWTVQAAPEPKAPRPRKP